MTLKAIDILQSRARKNACWFLMSGAASIGRMIHALDYDRALGELLELDDTVRASIEHLRKIGELHNTLIVVTADHGHGFVSVLCSWCLYELTIAYRTSSVELIPSTSPKLPMTVQSGA